ncbi:TetR family transcriptional regulator [Planotetraspora thailandica]|uniref:TetR family transcriptional regulator n=1 Tax=Planotetraspora thailandica TaxID=487172 RepID=A0A8J3V6G7_9ACTN|nr:TetR/AcrR family transcriptional regulator [Planotetraspora thailandica]GII56890.1 TetR family transcriptional regulator [Planotetraspora thailandica]
MSPRKAAVLQADGGDRTLREHLIATAERLIAEHGTAGLTVRAIAREARVADGVLYNHFADKEELLALALHAHVRSVERSLAEPPRRAGEGDLDANLRAYIAYGVALHLAILPAFAGLLHQPTVLARFAGLPNPMAGGRGLLDELAEYLRAERRLGRLAPDAGVEAAATLIVGACHQLVLPRLLTGAPASFEPIPDDVIDDLTQTVLNGIALPPGSDTSGAGPAQPHASELRRDQ